MTDPGPGFRDSESRRERQPSENLPCHPCDIVAVTLVSYSVLVSVNSLRKGNVRGSGTGHNYFN